MDRWIDDRWIDGQTDQQTNRPNNSRTEHTKAMYPLLLDGVLLCKCHSVVHRLNSLDTQYPQIPKVRCSGWYHCRKPDWLEESHWGWMLLKVTLGTQSAPFFSASWSPDVSSYVLTDLPNQMSNTESKINLSTSLKLLFSAYSTYKSLAHTQTPHTNLA